MASLTYATPRDALTGEPLRLGPGALVIRLRDGGRPEPLRLHTQQVETAGAHGGGLGGHCFSRDFARYLARVQPTAVEQGALQVRCWWASAYGRSRVRARFLRAFGQERGALRYQVALALAASYRDYPALMTETGHSAHWLYEQTRIAARYAAEPSGLVRAVRAIEPRRDGR